VEQGRGSSGDGMERKPTCRHLRPSGECRRGLGGRRELLVSHVERSIHPLGESTNAAEVNLTRAGPPVRRPTLTMAFRHRTGGDPLAQLAVAKRVIERKETRDRQKQNQRQAGNRPHHPQRARPSCFLRVTHLAHASTAARSYQSNGQPGPASGYRDSQVSGAKTCSPGSIARTCRY